MRLSVIVACLALTACQTYPHATLTESPVEYAVKVCIEKDNQVPYFMTQRDLPKDPNMTEEQKRRYLNATFGPMDGGVFEFNGKFLDMLKLTRNEAYSSTIQNAANKSLLIFRCDPAKRSPNFG